MEIARRIGFRRNSVIHGGDILHPNDVILSTTTAIGEYKGVMETDMSLLELEGISVS